MTSPWPWKRDAQDNRAAAGLGLYLAIVFTVFSVAGLPFVIFVNMPLRYVVPTFGFAAGAFIYAVVCRHFERRVIRRSVSH